MSKLRQLYFKWLCNLVKGHRKSYTKLCRELHNKPFRWSVPNDDNRCEDGINLRDTFIQESEIVWERLDVKNFLSEECTVLELLVALARRIDFIMYDLHPEKDRTHKWFGEMIRNLGLAKFNDSVSKDRHFDPISEAEIDGILEALMDRTYGFQGEGSLFPLRKQPKKDRTRVEIWYQMMDYLEERYG